MKVILNQDIPKIGRKYETYNVADGFARNYLLPRKLAEIATKSALARVALVKSIHDEQLQLAETELMKQLEKLSKAELTVKEKANEQGHLFAGIRVEELQKLIKEQVGIEIPVVYINLPKPIKETGEHVIKIVVQDKKTTIKLNVVSTSNNKSK